MLPQKVWILTTLLIVAGASGLGYRAWVSSLQRRAEQGVFRYEVDARQAIGWDAKNIISGWTFSRETEEPVVVTLIARGETLASQRADRPQGEKKETPHANRNGFEFVLKMRDLPRGRYPVSLLFEDALGNCLTVSATEVINDRPFGKVVAQGARLVNPQQVVLRAWVYDEDGIADALLLADGRDIALPLTFDNDTGLPPDLIYPLALPNIGPALTLDGQLFTAMVPLSEIPVGLHRLEVQVTDNAGQQAILPGPLVWNSSSPPSSGCPGQKLKIFYPVEAGSFAKIDREVADLKDLINEGCLELGLGVRVEYLRTTAGDQHDFLFDPDFPESIRQAEPGMTTLSLNQALDMAARHRVPLLISLDGGVWADAKFSAPEWDIVDVLEQDDAHVQWNQYGRTEPDDALRHLPGSYDSPQLARMMSLNIYNTRYRAYKKRNLQLAVQRIVEWMTDHPTLSVTISLDPDSSINSWFSHEQWYDYNPATLQQFREWLTGTGVYQKGSVLYGKGYAFPLSVINTVASQHWQEIAQISPPRDPLEPEKKDPWHQLWIQFKRHLVAEHYADLARWAAEVGLSSEQIYTGQAFSDAAVAVHTNDPALNWFDQAGVSIEGGKPPDGHIGAILYGATTRNEGRPRFGLNLLWNIQRADPAWGVVEFHPAAIRFAEHMPSHAQAYRSMQVLYNHGAHFLTPRYGGSIADRELRPESFRSYATLQGSAFEYEFFWWLKQVRDLPLGSSHFPFGNTHTASDDGWTATRNSTLTPLPGYLVLETRAEHLTLRSPEFLPVPLQPITEIVVRGQWPAGAGLSAHLGSREGPTQILPCLPDAPAEWVCRKSEQTDFSFTHIDLVWSLPTHHQSPIQLDSVSLIQSTLFTDKVRTGPPFIPDRWGRRRTLGSSGASENSFRPE